MQREQATGWVGQQSGDCGQFGAATDERGRLERQAAGQLLLAARRLIGNSGMGCGRERRRAIKGPLRCAQGEERRALRCGDASQIGDVHAPVGPITPQGLKMLSALPDPTA